MHKRVVFDDSKGSTFRKTAPTMAVLNEEGAIYFKSWAGEGGQSFPGSHMTMIALKDDAPCGNVYGCALDEFNSTYVASGAPNIFRKAATIRAYQPGFAFEVTTTTDDNNVEVAENRHDANSWIVQNPGGEIYGISDEEFRRTYVEVTAT